MKRRYVADIKRGRADAQPSSLPPALQQLFEDHRAGSADEAAVCRQLAPFVAANFVQENVGAADLFALEDGADEVDAVAVSVFSFSFRGGALLPALTAGAVFELDDQLGLDDDGLMEWQEEHDFLTDAVNFFWRWDGFEAVIADHGGAGFGLEGDAGDAEEADDAVDDDDG